MWLDETDKIEIPQTAHYTKNPVPMSMLFAWPETIDDHWNRIYAITQEAKVNRWKYRRLLPYRKKFLSLYRKAFDGQKCPRWVMEKDKEELYVGLCVDDNRRPIPYLDAIKPLELKSAKGLAYRDAKGYLQSKQRNERLNYHKETVESVAWFRKNMLNKLVYWEKITPEGWVWKNRCHPERPLYVSKVSQNVQNENINKLTIVLVDKKFKQFTATFTDFKAWVEDGVFYVTEIPYIGVCGRKMGRNRFKFL